MILGEKVNLLGSGKLVGIETGRVIANFLDLSAGECFRDWINIKPLEDSGIIELDTLCKKYNDGNIDINELIDNVWNTALNLDRENE
jgi:hypothetical protein